MFRRHLPLAALVAALAVTGCGSDEGTPSGPGGSANKSAQSAPVAPLRVGATAARVGDATTATRAEGLRELRVPDAKVDPREVGRRIDRRDGVGAGASCANTTVMPAPENLPVVEAATLCLLNGERADAGLAPLTTNSKLAASAIGHTNDMIANQYFSHSGLDGSDVVSRIKATGYIDENAQWTVGENLAWGTGTLATPQGIVNAWMNSQGHRENILNGNYREIGFGTAIGNPRARDGQGATYTTNFGAIEGNFGDSTSAPQVDASANVAGSATTSDAAAAAKRKAAAKRRAAKRRRARAARARAAKRRRAAAARRRAAAARRS